MKRTLLFVTALFAAVVVSKAQQQPQTVVVTDTVHYFYNKFHFKNGIDHQKFPYFKSAAATSTRITHVGVKFENSEPLDICGLEAFMARHQGSAQPGIPTRLYLCLLDNQGMPDLDQIIDSIQLMVTGDTLYTNVAKGGQFGKIVNGQFEDTCYTLTTDFAILARNVSLASGDSVRIMRTNGKTGGHVTAEEKEKIGDGFGFVRYFGKFYTTMNFPSQLAPLQKPFAHGFGPPSNPFPMDPYTGTDYEFCLAPRVQYTLTSQHTPDAGAQTMLCPWQPAVYTSQSSKRFLQRQYNLVEFARYWNRGAAKFVSNTLKINGVDVFPSDSSVGWYFAPEDCFSPAGGCNPPDARIFLHYQTQDNKVTFITDSVNFSLMHGGDSLTCFPHNQFRTRYKTMKVRGEGHLFEYDEDFTICTSPCGLPMTTGTAEHQLSHVKVFPNPAANRVTVTGLSKEAEVKIYSTTGQLLTRKRATGNGIEIDLDDYAKGVYLIRITQGEASRSVRLLKE